MKNKNDISRREKSATVGLVVCFVAMIAIVGMITFGQYQRREKIEQQLAETESTEKNDTKEKQEETPEQSQSANTDSIQAELETPVVETPPIVEPAPSVSQSQALSFSASDVLIWPVDGNVLLSYSMDQTVYFSTLDQYKYNPAIIISGEVGGDVLAAAAGEITSIETTAQTGTTITMKLGDGYELVYGQIKEVCVHEGDYVTQGDVLGYVSEPTKYYSVEGPNLYFQLLKDGEPVNPLEYLEA
ncbi:MAG: peptidoglycan DD-metalloendopeptidase family protein [Faecalimonas sp.]|nr:peptidoglycan DD-metalloendopeptidase family protein [Faecalimonas sp.]